MTSNLDELIELRNKLDAMSDEALKLIGYARLAPPRPTKPRTRTKLAFTVREALFTVPELRSTWKSSGEIVDAVQSKLPNAQAPTIRAEIGRQLTAGKLKRNAKGLYRAS